MTVAVEKVAADAAPRPSAIAATCEAKPDAAKPRSKAEPHNPDTYAIEHACEQVVDLSRKAGALYDEAGTLKNERARHLQVLLLEIGRDMLLRGQKSKTVGHFKVTVGVTKIRICGCHGTYASECDTVGQIIVIDRGYEPFVRVTDTRKADEDAD